MAIHKIKIFSGRGSEYLAEKIAASFGTTLGQSEVLRFSDGEFQPCYNESIRGCTVFIIQSTFPPSDNLMELLMMIDAARRASAYKVDGRDPLLRLGAAGPQGPSPRADRRQTGSQPADGRRRGPRDDDGPARRPDSGILRRSGRCALCQRHLHSLYQKPENRGPLDRRSRHGRRQTRQHLRQAARAPRSSFRTRSAPRPTSWAK